MKNHDKMADGLLPGRPSELIRFALNDLKACEEDPSYEVGMGSWHSPRLRHRLAHVTDAEPTPHMECKVCLAGSVMAKTLKIPLRRYVSSPNSMDDREHLSITDTQTRQRLWALDRFRTGNISSALNELRLTPSPGIEDTWEISRYVGRSSEGFFQSMNDMADHLERHGF